MKRLVPAVFLPLLATCDAAPDATFGPYLQNLTPTSVFVCWVTGMDASGSVSVGATTVTGPIGRYHQIKLTALSPETLYHYTATSKVGGTVVFSGSGTFKAAPSDPAAPYTFVHLGEEHTSGFLSVVAPSVLAAEPLFIISAGDQCDWGSEVSEWKLYFDDGAAFFRRIPLFCALNNHIYVKRAPTTFIHDEGDYVPIPGEPGKHLFKKIMNQPGNEEFYSVRYGPSLFLFLNSTWKMDSPAWILGDQLVWLTSKLLAANDGIDDPKFIVVTFHHPIEGSATNDAVFRDLFEPIFKAFGVDLIINGHEVITEHVFKDGIHHAQVSTGSVGGDIVGVIPESLFIDDVLHTIGVGTVTPTALTYKFVDGVSGAVLHEFTIPAP